MIEQAITITSSPSLPHFPSAQLIQVYTAAANEQFGPEFIATHNVHAFNYLSNPYVLKQANKFAVPINFYYAAQDAGFLKSRSFFATRNMQLLAEAKKLARLQNQCLDLAPKLYHFDRSKSTLIKSYIGGVTFREMNSDYQKKSLPGIVKLVQGIHDSGIAIGDAHIKNAIRRNSDHKFLWLDFDGCFAQDFSAKEKAHDLIKLVYSTFTETRDLDLALSAAEAMEKYVGGFTRSTAVHVLNQLSYTPLLRFATRTNRQQHNAIKGALIDVLQIKY